MRLVRLSPKERSTGFLPGPSDRRGLSRAGYTFLLFKMGWETMGQTSHIVTIVDGVQVIDMTVHDPNEDLVETFYQVRGARYEDLGTAMKAARGEVEGGPKG